MQRAILSLILLLTFAACQNAALPPSDLSMEALVVGIGDYPSFAGHVPKAGDDARRVADALTQAGFSVTSLIDKQADKASVLAAWRAMLANSDNGLCVFYFAGIVDRSVPLKFGDPVRMFHFWSPAEAPAQEASGMNIGRETEEFIAGAGGNGNLIVVVDHAQFSRDVTLAVNAGGWRIRFFGASSAEHPVKPGALSDSFCDALRGAADFNSDGRTSLVELARLLFASTFDKKNRAMISTNLDLSKLSETPLWAGSRKPAGAASPSTELERMRIELVGRTYQEADWALLRSLAADDRLRADLRLQAIEGFLRKYADQNPDREAAEKLRRALQKEMSSIDANMVKIPGGIFAIGCNPQTSTCMPEDPPWQTVEVAPFFLDRYEVTFDEYQLCTLAGQCPPADPDGSFCTAGHLAPERAPVNCVDWPTAKKFCEFAGKRLPTEAEWERAARGDDGRVYPWGNQFDATRVNWNEHGRQDGNQFVAPVGSYPTGASPYGALDMAGNLIEWVQSAAPGLTQNENQRVAKGSGWGAIAEHCTTYRRWLSNENFIDGNWGFRCARSVTE